MRLLAFMFLCFFSVPAMAGEDGFESWLSDFRTRAYDQGISAETINSALYNTSYLPRVIELDRNQPEFKMTYDEYMSKVASHARAQQGKQLLKQHKGLLSQISKQYGVPAEQIVALWGIESDFGRITGNFRVIDALATLAYEGRRAQYFERELITALKIIDKDHIAASEMIGSWAGAMGQSQFMPTTFYNYAVDFNKNGRIDIWQEQADIFASAANYLSKSGWKSNQRWGQKVTLQKSINDELLGTKVKKTMREWSALGVRDARGRGLAKSNLMASLVKPKDGPYFLVTSNYNVIMTWNRSTLFALAAGQLADAIAGKSSVSALEQTDLEYQSELFDIASQNSI